jgi:prevent-host-death family protein
VAQQIKRNVVRMTELHRRLSQVIRKVALSDEHFVVEKGGLPVVVMLSMSEYERLDKDWKLEEFERIARSFGEEAERKGITEEQLMTELEETKKEVYQDAYDKKQA